MTAYSTTDYAQRETNPQDKLVPLVTIRHGHPINNPHRAPFMSGASSARALFEYARKQLADPEKGKDYFIALRREFNGAALDAEALRKRLLRRQAQAARALASSDLELSAEQLVISADLSRLQGLIAERLIPNVLATGYDAETVIGVVDKITRQALGNTVDLHEQRLEQREERPRIAWQDDMAAQLAAARERTGNTSPEAVESDMALLRDFDIAINKLEATLPDAVERPEPLWDIDEIPLDSDAIAVTSQNLINSLGDGPDSWGRTVEERARQAVWSTMSKAERQALATHVMLKPGERVEYGLQIINSTPPLVRLPESSLTTGRFNVRMSTTEEAAVVEALLNWAGANKSYPGPEASLAALDAMAGNVAQAARSDVQTIGLVVDENPASLERARQFVASISADTRVLIHASNEEIRAELSQLRTNTLAAAGIDRPVLDNTGADRSYGGWSLPGTNDRVLGASEIDADIIVASSDAVIAFTNRPALDITGVGRIDKSTAEAEKLASNAVIALEEELEGIAKMAGEEAAPYVKSLLGLMTKAGYSPDRFVTTVENTLGGKGQVAARNEVLDVTGLSREELKIATNAIIAAGTKEITSSFKLRLPMLQRRRLARNGAWRELDRLQQQRERIGQQDRSLAFRRAGGSALVRAQIVSNAARLGNLQQVYVPASSDDKFKIQTGSGELTKMAPADAARAANMLLDGAEYASKQVRDALNAGIGSRYDGRASLVATLVASSNFFSAEKGAKEGLEELTFRLNTLPEQGAVLIDDNEKNPAALAVQEWSEENKRRVIKATAWRVVDQIENSLVRSTKLDLGFGSGAATPREFNANALKRSTVVITGGGQMDGRTWDAIQDYLKAEREAKIMATGAAKAGLPARDGLSPGEALALVARINQEKGLDLKAPDLAGPQKSRAIMQEALVDFADQALIGTDLGKDYHSANLIRLAAETGKISAIIDKKGATVPVSAAYQHSLEFAQSISERTLKDLGEDLALSTQSNMGQLVLSNLPGLRPAQARQMAESFATLGDIQSAAANARENPEAAAAIPANARADLGTPIIWSNAISQAKDIVGWTRDAGMRGLTGTDEKYPATLADKANSPILYTIGLNPQSEEALTQPAVALLTGEKATANAQDIASIKAIAADAAAKDWSVAIHLNGDLAAKAVSVIAELPKNERPGLVVIGDGHPAAYASTNAFDSVITAAKAGGVFITATPPTPRTGTDREAIQNGTFAMQGDRDRARDLLGEISQAMIVVKANGRDPSLLSLKRAIDLDVPVAAVSGARDAGGKIQNIDFGRPDYAANRQMIAGQAEFKISAAKSNDQIAPATATELSNEQAAKVRIPERDRPVLTLRGGLSEEAVRQIDRVSGRDMASEKLPSEVPARAPEVERAPVPDASVGGIDLSEKGYGANRRLVGEAAHFEVETNKRQIAFSPTSIPDISEQLQEGSRIFGDLNQRQRAGLDELNYSTALIESGSTIVARIDLRETVPAVDPAGGARRFLEAVENNEIGRQKASEAELAARALEADKRFLDIAGRDTVSEEIRAEFREHTDRSQDEIRKDASASLSTVNEQERDVQLAMAAMKQGGRGR